jgi:NADPH-dependent 2,4-dienoyl-CoA reductase/sulfur reductase-like enzyme
VPAEPAAGRRKVVIVGGGFGGLAAARRLRHADVDVTLVDRTNHHLFQPLLYQVAAGGLAPSDCASPIRPAVKRSSNSAVLMAEVTDIDAEHRQVVLDRGERLDYDSLIVACGAQTSYFGHDEWQHVTCGLKTLADAVELRTRFYGAFERAERTDDAAQRDEWLTFVVVGGGPTGVEVAGQLAITAQAMKRHFRRIDASAAKVILLDAGDRVLAAFSERLSGKVADQLAELGVTVRERSRATTIDAGGVTIEVDGAKKAAPGIGHGRDPASSSRGQGHPRRAARGLHAVPLLRQGRPRRGRQGKGGLRDQGAGAVWPFGLLHLPRRPPLLPRRANGQSRAGAHQVDRGAIRRARERTDRGRARHGRSGIPAGASRSLNAWR